MTCPLCSPTPHEILFEDDFCRVVLLNDANYPAYCRVELIDHVKEMTDLAPEDRTRIMKTVFAVESAMREMIAPDKINLASLGNKTPHVHWHIIPRFKDDKHFPNSHWGEAVRHELQANSHQASSTSVLMFKEKINSNIDLALS